MPGTGAGVAEHRLQFAFWDEQSVSECDRRVGHGVATRVDRKAAQRFDRSFGDCSADDGALASIVAGGFSAKPFLAGAAGRFAGALGDSASAGWTRGAIQWRNTRGSIRPTVGVDRSGHLRFIAIVEGRGRPAEDALVTARRGPLNSQSLKSDQEGCDGCRGGRSEQTAWQARLRFAIIGPWLAAPPSSPGELRDTLKRLAKQSFRDPITGTPVGFGFASLERWYYAARKAQDPVAV